MYKRQVRELVEETESDQDETFSFDNWPGELETSGSIQWDALAVQRNIRQERVASGNIPEGNETLKAPSFKAWAKAVHVNEYNVMLVEPDENSLTAITCERIARATQNDPTLRRILQLIRDGNYTEITQTLKEMNSPRIGKGTTINYLDLSIYQECVMVQNRFWIPSGLEQDVAAILHLGHKGVSNMIRVASTLCYWSGITNDIYAVSTECLFCRTQAPLPPNKDPVSYTHLTLPTKA